MNFLGSINPSSSDSYKNAFLSFDIDWAHDDIIQDTINLVCGRGCSATWMITHESELITQLSQNPKFELGIHPNFNLLLKGTSQKHRNAESIIDELLNLVPCAKIVRSHSLTQSSRLSAMFYSKGILYESNDYLPAKQIPRVDPWTLECGIIKLPYFFSDELACLNEKPPKMTDLVKRDGLKIFNFHPIHVFLNTECVSRYETTKELHSYPKELIKHRYSGYGTRSRLLELLAIIDKA